MNLLLFFGLLIPVSSWATPVPSGFPNKGILNSGKDLFKVIKENSKILKSVSPEEYQYGTVEMESAILAIGNWAGERKQEPVWIGDISKKGGGQLARHLTHQRGLDADIAYLVHSHKLVGHRSNRFHDRFTEQFGLKGKMEENFDLESNYNLFKHLVLDLNVKKLFVGCGIYDALEAYDKKQAVSIMERIFAEKGHEDHFHVRLKCPPGASECSDEWWIDPTKPVEKRDHDRSSQEKYREC